MKREKKPNVIFLDVALLIVCFAIVTSCLVSGVFAKFVMTTGTNKELARVTSFNVDAIFTDNEATVDGSAGREAAYKISLANASEAAVRYSIEIRFNEDVSQKVRPKLGENAPTISDGGRVYTWTNAGTLDAGGLSAPKTRDVDFVLEVLNGASDSELEFFVNIVFVQVD